MLIAICGIDGSGKTTQIEMLKNYLETSQRKKVIVTKQPTDFYRSYKRFRQYVNREEEKNGNNVLYELALLSATDKLKHYDEEIFPNPDHFIISDRYVFSAYAYFLARGITDIKWLKEINKHLPLPDVTIYIDVMPQTAYNRIIMRDGQYTKKEETDLAMLESVRNNFIVQPWGENPNYHIIYAEKKTKFDVHKDIITILSKYMEEK